MRDFYEEGEARLECAACAGTGDAGSDHQQFHETGDKAYLKRCLACDGEGSVPLVEIQNPEDQAD